MPKFRYLGDYEANVTLPDGSVRLVTPGQVCDLPMKTPGPAWAPATPAAPAAPTTEPADVKAWLAAHPTEEKP